MRKLILLFLLALSFLAKAQSPTSPIQLTTNSAYLEPSTGLHWNYNGATYAWWTALGLRDSTRYVTPYYLSHNYAPIGSGVTSFNGRTGGVMPLVGDYSAFYGSLSQQNTNTSDIALRELLSNKATTFGTLNNTLYPTTQAVANYVTTSSPVTSVFSRIGVITAQSGDYSAFYPLLTGSYPNPSWIPSLAYSKLTGTPDLSVYELLANKSTNTSLGTSNTLYPSQNAVKTYVDNAITGNTYTAGYGLGLTANQFKVDSAIIVNKTFAARYPLKSTTVAGFDLRSNITFANLTNGYGLSSFSYNSSSAVSPKVDTTLIQTIANFFPKGDTRYAPITGGVYKLKNDSTGSSGFTTRDRFDNVIGAASLARINLRVKYTDTAAMLSTYAHAVNISTIANLQSYAGTARTIIVTDSKRGGIFNYVSSGLTSNTGTIFSATGIGSGYWQRQYQGIVQSSWFGVVADGTTNDQPALQAAVTFVLLTGGQLQLPIGNVRITSPIDFTGGTKKIEFFGQTNLTSVITADFTSVSKRAALSVNNSSGTRAYVRFHDFQLAGINDANTLGIYCNYTGSFSTIERVFILQFYDGIRVANDVFMKVINCYSDSNLHNGITIGLDITGADGPCNNVSITGGLFNLNVNTGIEITSSFALTISGASTESNLFTNVSLINCNGVSITGWYSEYDNTLSNVQTAQMQITGCYGVVVSGAGIPAIDNNNNPVIDVVSASNVTFEGLSIGSPTGTTINSAIGINLNSCRAIEIKSVYINGTSTGISVGSLAQVMVSSYKIEYFTNPIVTANASGSVLNWKMALPSDVTACSFGAASLVSVQQTTGETGINKVPGFPLDVNGTVNAPQYNTKGSTSAGITAIKGSGFGNAPTTYPIAVFGATSGNGAIGLGYDPLTNTGGSFSGDGTEILVRNVMKIVQPNAGNTNFLPATLTFNNGNISTNGTFTASISAGAANNFVVSNSGLLQYRTAAQVLSDIGAAPSSGGGYVSSIATSTGILGGTITSTGTLKADTSVLQTVLNFKPLGSTYWLSKTATTLPATFTSSSLTSFGSSIALGTPASGVITNLTGTCTSCNIGGNAATVTNGVYTTGTQTVGGAKIFTSPITVQGVTATQGVAGKGFGYDQTTYPAVQIGAATGNRAVSFMYDPTTNSGGSFAGNGTEMIVPNVSKIIQPNSGNTDWLTALTFNNGNVSATTQSANDNSTKVATTAYVDAAGGSTSSGTYTPTLTNNTNIASSAVQGTPTYLRIGNVVHVSMAVNVTPTTASSNTILYFTLPSGFNSSSTSLWGVANGFGATPTSGAINYQSSTEGKMTIVPPAGSSTYYIQFDYSL